ncbi:MAG: hypothetical protein OHK0023_27780 [Anaerolineae bacterium]
MIGLLLVYRVLSLSRLSGFDMLICLHKGIMASLGILWHTWLYETHFLRI